MADLVGAAWKGYEYGRQKTAARAQAEYERMKDQREYELDLAKHSLEIRKTADAAWDKITGMISSEDWEPSMTGHVLDLAAQWTNSYGQLYGRDGVAEVARALHLGGEKKAPAKKQPEVQGPPAPGAPKATATKPEMQGPMSPQDTARANPMLGFFSEAQRESYDKRALARRMRQFEYTGPREMAAKVYQAALDERTGLLDPQLAVLAAEEFYTRAVMEQGLDSDDAWKALDPAWKLIEEMFDKSKQQLTPEQLAQLRTEERLMIQGLNDWADSMIGVQNENFGFTIGPDMKPLQAQMHNDIAILASKRNYSYGTIQAKLAQKYVDETGHWVEGPAGPDGQRGLAPAYLAALRKAPPDFPLMIERFYDGLAPNIAPQEFEPIWDKDTNTGWMRNLADPSVGSQIYPWPGMEPAANQPQAADLPSSVRSYGPERPMRTEKEKAAAAKKTEPAAPPAAEPKKEAPKQVGLRQGDRAGNAKYILGQGGESLGSLLQNFGLRKR